MPTRQLEFSTLKYKSPRTACLLSAILGGAGHIYLGQKAKGVIIILASVAGLIAFIIPGLVVIILGMIDAYLIAKRLQKYRKVGSWDFFWSSRKGRWHITDIVSIGRTEELLGAEDRLLITPKARLKRNGVSEPEKNGHSHTL